MVCNYTYMFAGTKEGGLREEGAVTRMMKKSNARILLCHIQITV